MTSPSFTVAESTSALYSCTLLDETGAVVGPSGLTTLTLTLYDQATGAFINSRNAQNVLNLNGVVVANTLSQRVVDGKTVSYNLLWTMDPADNALQDATRSAELHVALVKWTYGSGGSKSGRHEFFVWATRTR